MDMNKLHEAKEMERKIIDLAVCIEKLGLGVTFKDCWQSLLSDANSSGLRTLHNENLHCGNLYIKFKCGLRLIKC